MTRWMSWRLLLVLPVLISLIVSPPLPDFDYAKTRFNGAEAALITAYNGRDADPVIPDTLGGLPVAGIRENAFEKNGNLRSVWIPDSVVFIGEGAFRFCTGLERVRIPAGVNFSHADKQMGKDVQLSLRVGGIFNGCTALTDVTLEDGLTAIGMGMFSRCTALTAIRIPDSVRVIGLGAFLDCTALETVVIPEGVEHISSDLFSGCTALREVSIPATVTKIGDRAFKGCTALTGLVIPEGVTAIAADAFEGCTDLTLTVTRGSTAAAYCRGKSIRYAYADDPETVYTVEWGETDGTRWVTNEDGTLTVTAGSASGREMAIPAQIGGRPVTVIGGRAYAVIGKGIKGQNQVSLVIPEGVISVGEKAFSGRSGLLTVSLPASLTDIAEDAFEGCGRAVFTVVPSSFAEAWCAEHGLSYEYAE